MAGGARILGILCSFVILFVLCDCRAIKNLNSGITGHDDLTSVFPGIVLYSMRITFACTAYLRMRSVLKKYVLDIRRFLMILLSMWPVFFPDALEMRSCVDVYNYSALIPLCLAQTLCKMSSCNGNFGFRCFLNFLRLLVGVFLGTGP